MDKRLIKLRKWLEGDLSLSLKSLQPASADASFRRYFRAETDRGVFIVMDAPPEQEEITPFIDIANALRTQGVHAPQIHQQNIEDGFLLLEDLGSRTYLDELGQNAQTLYSDALDSLVLLQNGATTQPQFDLERYNGERLEQEMGLFEHWYLDKHLGEPMHGQDQQVWARTKRFLIDSSEAQPQVWVHRDYHSRNLMITAQNSPGVIDFQDMLLGPISYDLASIFKDCYIEWPRAQQHQWLSEYRQKAINTLNIQEFSLEQLIRWVDLIGLQRHLKVLGIFCRLYYRDGKNQYLNDLPLVAKYVQEVLDLYPELAEFKASFGTAIQASLQ